LLNYRKERAAPSNPNTTRNKVGPSKVIKKDLTIVVQDKTKT
jgi:hypothetical protein